MLKSERIAKRVTLLKKLIARISVMYENAFNEMDRFYTQHREPIDNQHTTLKGRPTTSVYQFSWKKYPDKKHYLNHLKRLSKIDHKYRAELSRLIDPKKELDDRIKDNFKKIEENVWRNSSSMV